MFEQGLPGYRRPGVASARRLTFESYIMNNLSAVTRHNHLSPARNHGDDTVGMKKRLCSFFGVLLIGLILCINGSLAFFLYPMGISYFICTLARFKKEYWNSVDSVVLGWLLYLILLFFVGALPQRKYFRILMAIMIILTLMNVAGCQMYLYELSQIGK